MRRSIPVVLFAIAMIASPTPASAQPSREGIAERIAQAVEMAMLAALRLAERSAVRNFEEFWAKEVARTRAALIERLALPDAEVEVLIAPMLAKAEPLPDTMPTAEARAICNAAGEWTLRLEKLLVSTSIEQGEWQRPRPLTGEAGADDAAVLDTLSRTLAIWRMAASCDVLSQTVMESTVRKLELDEGRRTPGTQALRSVRMAKMKASLMLEFGYQLEPAQGTLGELRAFCKANAETIAKTRDRRARCLSLRRTH